MKASQDITTLFLDIGGVLLTDGWDHHARERAAAAFRLDLAEVNDRHLLAFDTLEEGKLTLKEYLDIVVFYRRRAFTRDRFQRFMFRQSKSLPGMISLVSRLKLRHSLKITVVSNESRELNSYRIRKFRLDRFVDSFVSSCFVHIRKPDADIFRLALDISQVSPRQVLYIENTPTFVWVAERMGIRSILHADYATTSAKLSSFGLNDAGAG